MAEYIEREAVCKNCKNINICTKDGKCPVIKTVAADVAPVVRCSECRYSSVIPYTELYLCRKAYTGCRADFFCSDGERKGDDATN